MNKLNKKGFTLVELLAVIIILAIVVGITIPAVLTTTSSAKKKAFQTAANTMADWVDRQYQVYTTGISADGIATLDPTFEDACLNQSYKCTGTRYIRLTKDFANAAGIKSENISVATTNGSYTATQSATSGCYSRIHINKDTGRSCVILISSITGDYNTTGSTEKMNVICGGVCDGTSGSTNYCKEGIYKRVNNNGSISCTYDE